MPHIDTDGTAPPLAHTIDGAAKASATSRTAIYDALAKGKLKAVKHGTRTLIPDANLVAWVESFPPAEFGQHRGIRGRQKASSKEAA